MPDVENIRVMARVNPRPDDDPCVQRVDGATLVPLESGGSQYHHKFHFDHVFDVNSRQEEVFDNIGIPTVDKVMEGYNGTVFAYGQTGSGKTHTMLAPSGGHPSCLDTGNAQYENRGLIPRVMTELFQRLEDGASPTKKWGVTVSFYEIYNEEIIDLLTADGAARTKVRLEGTRDAFRINGLMAQDVKSPADLLMLVVRGTSRRHVAATKMNDTSSRSHSILQVNVTQRDEVLQNLVSSQLNLVDLAGCESLGRTGATGQTAQEGMKINLSLTTLGLVINQLCRSEKFVSFRDSLLTRVLQNSLGGNTLTTMIVTMSQLRANHADTVACLRFAERAKQIKCKARINKQRTAAEWELIFRQAEDEIAALKQRLATQNQASPTAAGPSFAEVPSDEMAALLAKLESARQDEEEQRELAAEKERQLFEAERMAAAKAEALTSADKAVKDAEKLAAEMSELYQVSKENLSRVEEAAKAERKAKDKLQRDMAKLSAENEGLKQAAVDQLEMDMLDIQQKEQIKQLEEKLRRVTVELGQRTDELKEAEQVLEEEKNMSRATEASYASQLETFWNAQNSGEIQQIVDQAVTATNDALAMTKRENKDLRDEIKSLREKNNRRSDEITATTAKLDEMTRKVQALEAVESHTKAAHNEARAAAQRHREDAELLKRENEALQEKLKAGTDSLKAEVAEVRAERDAMERRTADLNAAKAALEEDAKQKAEELAALQDRLRDMDSRQVAQEEELEENRERIAAMEKKEQRLAMQADEDTALLEQYQAHGRTVAELVTGNRTLSQGEKDEIMRVLNQILDQEERDTIDKLAQKISSEKAQHDLVLFVRVLLGERMVNLSSMRAELTRLFADGAVVPEHLEKNVMAVQRELSKVASVLGLQAFYDSEDEAARQEFIQKTVALQTDTDGLITELQEYHEITLVVCPFCALKFSKSEIKQHVDTAH